MAIINFSFDDMKDLPEEQIEALGLEIDEVNNERREIAIEVTPNRPDLLDFTGLQRAVEFISDKHVPRQNFYRIKEKPISTVTVGKNVKKVRPFIAVFAAKGVNLTGNKLKYIINFTEKLCETYGRKRKKIAIGLHNLDVVKFPLTYDAAKEGSFVPLGSKHEMGFNEILSKQEKGIEYGYTITDQKGKQPLIPFLRDSEKILSMIPIINSEATRVTESTTNLLIDITGTSEDSINAIAAVIACSLMDSGATIYPMQVAYSKTVKETPALEYKEVQLRLNEIDRTLGVKLTEEFLVTILNRLGYPAAKYGKKMLAYTPPYRLDVFNDQDVIEDIAIGFGYEKIVPLPIMSATTGLPNDTMEYKNRISLLMIGLGFTEAINPYLTNERANFTNMSHPISGRIIKLKNSKTENLTMIRDSVLPSLLQDLGISQHEKMPQRLFEVGSVFEIGDEGEVVETVHLALVSEHSKANFSEVRSVIQALSGALGSKVTIKEKADASFIEGRCAGIEIDAKRGVFGEVHPEVLNAFGIEEPVVAAEITLISRVEYFKS